MTLTRAYFMCFYYFFSIDVTLFFIIEKWNWSRADFRLKAKLRTQSAIRAFCLNKSIAEFQNEKKLRWVECVIRDHLLRFIGPVVCRHTWVLMGPDSKVWQYWSEWVMEIKQRYWGWDHASFPKPGASAEMFLGRWCGYFLWNFISSDPFVNCINDHFGSISWYFDIFPFHFSRFLLFARPHLALPCVRSCSPQMGNWILSVIV